jgi:hypothetical protein
MGASSTPENVMLVIGALGDAMAAQGKPVDTGTGLAAAGRALFG